MISRSYSYILDGTNTDYYYLKNVQGDVINILNSSGQVVVTYTYDAWGKVLSVTGSLASTVGQINPFRYRGYYYDTETGFYYLQTRYYDPEVGRFINADGYVSTGQGIIGNNMFAYCNNNPVGRTAFLFGMMFFGDTEQIHEQDVRHEYGHSVHFLQIGVVNYTAFVAIPSLHGYWTDAPDYYSQSWEYIADQLGGVQRTGYNYSADAKSNAARWWRISKNPLLALIQELLY